MKHVLALAIALSLTGCLSPHQEGGDPQPVVSGTVSLYDLGEALAKRVESGDKMTTQHAYKLAQIALKDAGLEADLGPVPDNKQMDDATRAEWAAKFRGLK